MVNFVGAGSGAEDLITVRGARLLGEADVVIYAGSLVNPKLLEYCKEGCEIHNSATMTLEEVVEVMEKAHCDSKSVVRLHTGDPSIYGAIREQMDVLDKKGIDYKVTPGVSSFSGAAAALGAEYTLPGVSQTVILTRMAGRTPVPESEGIKSLSSHGASMVIFLSAGLIPELVKELLLGGVYKNNTPAAIVYKATWPEERLFRCDIGSLERIALENSITKTALILVGDFLDSDYERSKLYDPGFSTDYRKAKTAE